MTSKKLFMCCHKPFTVVPDGYTPIQCGSALNPSLNGALADNTGDHISDKNREYCELTAHYYAWKNVQADAYGFCHYRRFFCTDIKSKKPYVTKKDLSRENLSQLLGDEAFWTQLLAENDIIVPRSEDMGLSARNHYCTSKYHYAEDLDLFLDILGRKCPELTLAAQSYLSQNRQYFCNMFVMRREFFVRYCEILFSVLEEFDQRKTRHDGFQSNRTDGYLGEIFTGIFVTYCRAEGAKITEFPRLDTECSWQKRLGYAILPPESKRRFLVKRFVKLISK